MNRLRPCFAHFSDHPDMALDVLKLLQAPIDFLANERLFSEFPLSTRAVILCPTLRHQFRESLSRTLFGSKLLLQLRMRLVTIDALLRASADADLRSIEQLKLCESL